jgi:DNA-directed RNA polymerase subunit RPC12/RpoP
MGMIYVCGTCRFVFERIGETDACPDCGRLNIKEATPDEKNGYLKNRAEFGEDGNGVKKES